MNEVDGEEMAFKIELDMRCLLDSVNKRNENQTVILPPDALVVSLLYKTRQRGCRVFPPFSLESIYLYLTPRTY